MLNLHCREIGAAPFSPARSLIGKVPQDKPWSLTRAKRNREGGNACRDCVQAQRTSLLLRLGRKKNDSKLPSHAWNTAQFRASRFLILLSFPLVSNCSELKLHEIPLKSLVLCKLQINAGCVPYCLGTTALCSLHIFPTENKYSNDEKFAIKIFPVQLTA